MKEKTVMTPGKIYLVGAGPGDPELLTVKGMRLLQEADLILYAGSLVNPVVLQFARPDAALYDSAGMVLEEIVRVLIEAARTGKKVVRLASGDPSLFGAMGEMTEPVLKAGLEFEVVPGVSSFLAGAASLKRELTVPEVSQTVILTRCEGRTSMPDLEKLTELARHRSTMVIFLSAHLAGKIERELLSVYPAETPVAVVYRASWEDEKIVRGRLSELHTLVRENQITKTALIYVGEFLASEGTRSRLYDATFSHGYRKASE
jgi:precorrin-4/cobalt-precorrin-4 C11-methyltransferase